MHALILLLWTSPVKTKLPFEYVDHMSDIEDQLWDDTLLLVESECSSLWKQKRSDSFNAIYNRELLRIHLQMISLWWVMICADGLCELRDPVRMKNTQHCAKFWPENLAPIERINRYNSTKCEMSTSLYYPFHGLSSTVEPLVNLLARCPPSALFQPWTYLISVTPSTSTTPNFTQRYCIKNDLLADLLLWHLISESRIYWPC